MKPDLQLVQPGKRLKRARKARAVERALIDALNDCDDCTNLINIMISKDGHVRVSEAGNLSELEFIGLLEYVKEKRNENS